MRLFILTIFAVVVGGMSTPYPASAQERLDQARMEALVGKPMKAAASGDLDRSEREFAELLDVASRDPDRSKIDTADMLESFGVLLNTYVVLEKKIDARRRSIPYLERAIPAYQIAFGKDDPEVATVLHSYADAAMELAPLDPPSSVDRSYEEAHRIRKAALGPKAPATLSVLAQLGRVKGLVSRVKMRASSLDDALNALETVVEASASVPANAPEMADIHIVASISLMIVRSRAERFGEGLAGVERLNAAYPERTRDLCLQVIEDAKNLKNRLKAAGDLMKAREVEVNMFTCRE